MDDFMYIPLEDTPYVFRILKIYHINEEISHLKCHPLIPPKTILNIFKGRFLSNKQKSSFDGKSANISGK